VQLAEGAVLQVASRSPLSGNVKLLLRAERARVVRTPIARADASSIEGTIASSGFGMLVRYTVNRRANASVSFGLSKAVSSVPVRPCRSRSPTTPDPVHKFRQQQDR
jgi:hypothetical protein